MSRMLGAAPVLADAIVEQLCAASDAAAQSHRPPGAETEAEADRLSAAIWHSIWPIERCAHLPTPACTCLHLPAAVPSETWHMPDSCGTFCELGCANGDALKTPCKVHKTAVTCLLKFGLRAAVKLPQLTSARTAVQFCSS